MSLQIGNYQLKSSLLLAPMAGITDRPYRDICRRYGAGLTVSEMISSDPSLLHSKKTKQRLIHRDEPEPRSVQILGTDPQTMANAARLNVQKGANIIDINMGCPAKKICSISAGSALMRDPKRVRQILFAVTNAVEVPVTLKIRSGWDTTQRNALEIAKIAEDSGISCLAIHGRTRSQAYTGYAEYETIRVIKKSICIPVIANGDIHSSKDAQFIFQYTGADALMLGRITHGQPWIIKEISDNLGSNERNTGINLISYKEKCQVALDHINAIHRYYGTDQGVRIARKHIGWYLINLVDQNQSLLKKIRKDIFSITDATLQHHLFSDVLSRQNL